jgi:16S rRNA (cytosine1402-N4)-methyltransferase
MTDFHTTVLKKETITYLQIKPKGNYIDATLGGGGHSIEILERGGRVLGLDVDIDAIEYVKSRIKNQKAGVGNNLTLVKGNFRDIAKLARENGFDNASGIVFDFGVSGHQLDTKERGFSFRYDSLLDMRMDQDLKIKALDLLKVLTRGELYELFTKYGEESNAYRIASNIVESRRVKPIETTNELKRVIERSIIRGKHEVNSVTRVFQALRIVVNDELMSIDAGLHGSLEILSHGGRIVLITFHSLEDRIAKHTFLDWEKHNIGKVITKKPILPATDEIEENSRSRSAKLRVFEKY